MKIRNALAKSEHRLHRLQRCASTIVMKGANYYVDGGLDRASHLRTDETWVASQLCADRTCFIPIWRTRNLIANRSEPRGVMLTRARARHLLEFQAPKFCSASATRSRISLLIYPKSKNKRRRIFMKIASSWIYDRSEPSWSGQRRRYWPTPKE